MARYGYIPTDTHAHVERMYRDPDDGQGMGFCRICGEDMGEARPPAEPGACAWGSGAYGAIGTVHIALNPDGEREECCTFG